MAGEQHRASGSSLLSQAPPESGLHQRVEARRRFIEQEQLGLGAQRCDQSDLLTVPLRVRAALPSRIELEPIEELSASLLVQTAA